MRAKELVLVVDDDCYNTTFMREVCEKNGYRVVEAHDGEEALKKAVEHQPDLILLDVMMPKLDGFEVLAQLRKATETSDTPILMTTALNDLEKVAQAVDLGADGYITKPVKPSELAKHIRTSLDAWYYRHQPGMLATGGAEQGEGPPRVTGYFRLWNGLDYEVARATRYSHPLGCVLLAIDGYDKIVERGQEIADQVVSTLMSSLKSKLRTVDRIFVVAESKFYVLLPETALPGAQVAMARVREAMRILSGDSLPAITLSGVLISLPSPRVANSQEMIRLLEKTLEDLGTSAPDQLISLE